MHLNVPADDDTKLRVFLRKCKWMVIAVLAPEFVVFIAVGQWLEVKDTVNKVRLLGYIL